MGPNPWDGAKQAIEKAYSNIIYATRTRDTKQPASFPVMKAAMILAIIFSDNCNNLSRKLTLHGDHHRI